ncbi:hypothetical protein AA0312_1296 [Acetobacter tropicalis NRIC 0312]|nr:hypothetical protein AA0312_1296 [Acetobacter tropicalis NRIC 0312]
MLQELIGKERELLGRLCRFLSFGSLRLGGEAHNLGHSLLPVENLFLGAGLWH